MTSAISFCDCMESLGDIFLNNSEITYVYCGSYFCDRYFITIPDSLWERAFEFCDRNKMSLVLVIPMPGPLLVDQVKQKVMELINKYHVSEIVINDFGMYKWLYSTRIQPPIWIGRLLSKDPRDPRYDIEPDFIKMHERASHTDLFGMHPYGVEADTFSFTQQVGDNNACHLALHSPIIYVTTGRICEFASIGDDISTKFRPGKNCKRQCLSHWIEYKRGGISYYKFGRGVYAHGTDVSKWRDLPFRLIHNSLIGRTTP